VFQQRYAAGAADQKSFKFVDTVELVSLQICWFPECLVLILTHVEGWICCYQVLDKL